MTGEELRELAFNHLKGENGLPKNEKKGWETMKKAADAGDDKAISAYANHIVESDPSAAAKLIEDACIETDCQGTYTQALYLIVKANPQAAAESLKKALTLEKDLTDTGYTLAANPHYYIAKIAEAANPDDKTTIIKHLSQAAILGCPLMTEPDYKACGRDRGVAYGKDELLVWLDSYTRKGIDTDKSVYVVKKVKNEGMAQAIMEANLDSAEAIRVFGKGRIKQIKSLTPKVVCEYQKIYEADVEIGRYPFTFRHQATNSVTYTTGSGVVDIGKTYAEYMTAFKSKSCNTDKNKKINDYEFDNGDFPANTRFRTNTAYDEVAEKAAWEAVHKLEKEVEENAAKRYLASQYGWYTQDIEYIIGNHADTNIFEEDYKYAVIFVPFYFFTFDLGKETATVRVNAFNGETDFHINNPFGLYSKDEAAEQKETDAKGEKPPKFSILGFIACGIVIPFFGFFLYLIAYGAKKAKYALK